MLSIISSLLPDFSVFNQTPIEKSVGPVGQVILAICDTPLSGFITEDKSIHEFSGAGSPGQQPKQRALSEGTPRPAKRYNLLLCAY